MTNVEEKDVAHALVFSGNVDPVECEACRVHWTRECLELFKDIQSYASEESFRSIPTSSLRSVLEININELLLIRPYAGMKYDELNYESTSTKSNPFLIARNSKELSVVIPESIEDWVDNHLLPFMERYELPDALRDSLFSLLDDKKLYRTEIDKFNLLPWGQAENGTAEPEFSAHGYSITANDIARLLEGIEIFPGLPPVMRIIGSDLRSNRAELTTPVIDDFQELGLFSLVCSISIETLPTVSKPFVYINFHRRRWVSSLNEKFTHNRNAWSYLLDEKSNHAYTFKMTKTKGEDGDWLWQPDEAFSALAKHFNLPNVGNVDELLNLGSKQGIKIGIRHSYSSDGGGYSGKNKLGAGVTERDRVDAFANIVERLKPLGFTVFDDFKKISNAKLFLKEGVISYLDPITLSMNIDNDKENLPDVSADGSSDFKELVNSIESEWVEMLVKNKEKHEDQNSLKKAEKVKSMSELNQAIIAECFPEQRQLVMLFVCQDQSQQDTIKYIVNKIFGGSIKVVSTLLPNNVHGPQNSLPGSELKLSDRLQKRKEIWEAFVSTALKNNHIDMCLIQADEFYTISGKVLHDDEVNKAAAKIAFSSHSGIPVQYLKPINTKFSKRVKQLEDYLNRIRSALYDLVFGHNGIVPAIPQRTSEYFSDNESKPGYIYGIAAFTVNKRMGSATRSEVAIATRISTKTGIPQVKLCHYGKELHVTDWLNYRSAVQYLCSRYNNKISLGKNKGTLTRQDIYRKFSESIFKEANNASGIVYLDAENVRSLYPWIADTKLGIERPGLLTSYPKLRLVRIRQQAPQIMVEKYRDGYLSPTSCKRIFKVEGGVLPIYWSLGLPLTQAKRGVSTYRSIDLPDGKGGFTTFAPYLKQAPTPNSVEFVVLAMPTNEPADQLVQYTTSLRVGVLQANFAKFVSKPAPLFIMGKLREYFEL